MAGYFLQLPPDITNIFTASEIRTFATWSAYSFTHTQFQTAGLTNDIEVVSLPLKTVVHAAILRPTTAFAGTATYTLSVGITGSLAKYIAASDVKAAVTNTLFYLVGASFVPGPENFGAATSVRIAATSTVQNLDQSSAGAATVYLLTSLLP